MPWPELLWIVPIGLALPWMYRGAANDDRQSGAAIVSRLTENGHLVFANYRIHDGRYVITHVEADPALRGTGAAARLMEAIVAHARANNLTGAALLLCGGLVRPPSRGRAILSVELPIF